MNSLTERFGNSLAVIGFPTNQFGRETHATEQEILASLEHVRPGGGFQPLFPLMQKVQVNGAEALPLFRYLREALPTVSDDCGGRGSDFLVAAPSQIIWGPVSRNDIGWNFEKFLINQEGRPVRRYSAYFETIAIAKDIETLLKEGPDALG